MKRFKEQICTLYFIYIKLKLSTESEQRRGLKLTCTDKSFFRKDRNQSIVGFLLY